MISDAVQLALVSSIAPTIAAVAALVVSIRNSRKLDEVKDGMQSKMLEAKQGEAIAVGTAAGIAGERDRHDATAALLRQPVVAPLGSIPTGTLDDPVAVKQVK